MQSDTRQICVMKRGVWVILAFLELMPLSCFRNPKSTSLVFLSSSERRILLDDFLGFSIFPGFTDHSFWNKLKSFFSSFGRT